MDSGNLQPENDHIHFGHLAIIALFAAALIFFTMMKNGFHFTLSSNASSGNTLITYQQAKADAESQNPQALNSDDSQLQDNLATLDPVNNGGAVLGASTDSTMFPPADQMLTPDMLNKIQVKTFDVNNASTTQIYSNQIAFIESQYNSLGMISDLNSQDPATLKKVEDTSKAIVAALAKITVPKELEQYHKIKMLYYTTLGFMAQSFEAGDKDTSVSNLTTIFFSLNDKLDSIAGDILNKYGVQL